MAWIHPAAVEHRRKLYTRPDGTRFLRHDRHRFGPPAPYEKSWAARIVDQIRAEEEQTAHDTELAAFHAEHLALRRELAELKFELAWRRLCRKYGYNPNQPRVPAGNPDGGQWTSDERWTGDSLNSERVRIADASNRISSPVLNDTVPDRLIPRAQGDGDNALVTAFAALRRGHHYVPQAVYKHRRLSPETRKVFEEGTTGPLEDKRLNVFSRPHRNYNKAVNEEFDRFLAKNNITEEQMTPDHARELLKDVITSRDPRIRSFNMRIWMRQMFRGGRFRGNE